MEENNFYPAMKVVSVHANPVIPNPESLTSKLANVHKRGFNLEHQVRLASLLSTE